MPIGDDGSRAFPSWADPCAPRSDPGLRTADRDGVVGARLRGGFPAHACDRSHAPTVAGQRRNSTGLPFSVTAAAAYTDLGCSRPVAAVELRQHGLWLGTLLTSLNTSPTRFPTGLHSSWVIARRRSASSKRTRIGSRIISRPTELDRAIT